MYYNINDILPFVDNYEFLEFFSSNEEDDFISSVRAEEDFDWNDGASKLVVIPEKLDYVIKIPFNSIYNIRYGDYTDMSQDYCTSEMELYEKVKKENPLFANLLLPLTYVEEFTKYDIYIQSKCVTFLDSSVAERKSSYSKESLEKYKSSSLHKFNRLPEEWMAAVFEYLGSEKLVQEFLNVLEKYDITQDLHNNNIGYVNGFPVILDYGSFYDSYDD